MSMITGKTKLLGVVGHPVEHSLSPVMHNAAIAHLNLNYVYLPFPVAPDQLENAVKGFEAMGVVGFNLTIPHKTVIIPMLREITPQAQAVGAVNTVWRSDGGWYGTNTDVEGFIAPLTQMGRDWTKILPVVLGNGGAARAVVAGLAQLGCPEIAVVGRNRDKLAQFWQSWRDSSVGERIKLHGWDDLSGLISETGLLVNTTPVGMYPQVDDTPVSAAMMEKLISGAIAYDLIYTPLPTKFLQLAQDQGATIVDGLEMLVQQGAAALKIWLDQPVPVEVMRRSLQQYLGI